MLTDYVVKGGSATTPVPTVVPNAALADVELVDGAKATVACYFNSSATQRLLFGFFSLTNVSTDICTDVMYLAAQLDANSWRISFPESTDSLYIF